MIPSNGRKEISFSNKLSDGAFFSGLRSRATYNSALIPIPVQTMAPDVNTNKAWEFRDHSMDGSDVNRVNDCPL